MSECAPAKCSWSECSRKGGKSVPRNSVAGSPTDYTHFCQWGDSPTPCSQCSTGPHFMNGETCRTCQEFGGDA